MSAAGVARGVPPSATAQAMSGGTMAGTGGAPTTFGPVTTSFRRATPVRRMEVAIAHIFARRPSRAPSVTSYQQLGRCAAQRRSVSDDLVGHASRLGWRAVSMRAASRAQPPDSLPPATQSWGAPVSGGTSDGCRGPHAHSSGRGSSGPVSCNVSGGNKSDGITTSSAVTLKLPFLINPRFASDLSNIGRDG
jgi:hypothetical protein